MFKIRDKVRVVDLSNSDVPKGYLNAIGVIKEIDNDDFPYRTEFSDGHRWWFSASEIKPVTATAITITSDGYHIVAAECNGKISIAKCSPDDEFSLETGAHLALTRLLGKQRLHMYTSRGHTAGIVGAATDYTDALGNKLFLGDTVKIYSKYTKKYEGELSLVTNLNGRAIVMGFGLHNADDINKDFLIIKERSFDTFASGDVVDGIIYK